MTQQQNGDRPLRLDAYIRVSAIAGREGDSFISPNVQDERIRAWAVAHGHEIIEAWHELDVSGGTMDRPLLNEVMARIDAGETDGVVVYRLDRFGRTLVGALELIHRIHKQGALFASVSDGFDITTETGRLVLNILLSIAQFERERMQESWRTARTAAVERGIHIASINPTGYRRADVGINPKTGKPYPAPLEVDPVTGPAVTELFRRKAAGATWAALRDWLETEKIPTTFGGPWSDQVVRRLIRNRTYLGIASGAGRGDLPDGVAGAHPALTDEATWHAANARRGMRHSRNPSSAVVSGLIRCGSCRYSMSGHWKGGRDQLVYACNKPFCPALTSITVAATKDGGAGLDEFVIGEMWEHLERVEFEGLDQRLDVEEDKRELDQLEAKRERDAQDTDLEQALGRPAWFKHLANLTAQINQMQDQLDEKLRRLGRHSGRSVRELREEWESGMSMDQKRAIMASAIQMVFIGRGGEFAGHHLVDMSAELRRAKFRERVRIVWATDPVVDDIPRQGRQGYVVKPWPFGSDANPDEAGVSLLQVPVEDAGDAVG